MSPVALLTARPDKLAIDTSRTMRRISRGEKFDSDIDRTRCLLYRRAVPRVERVRIVTKLNVVRGERRGGQKVNERSEGEENQP